MATGIPVGRHAAALGTLVQEKQSVIVTAGALSHTVTEATQSLKPTATLGTSVRDKQSHTGNSQTKKRQRGGWHAVHVHLYCHAGKKRIVLSFIIRTSKFQTRAWGHMQISPLQADTHGHPARLAFLKQGPVHRAARLHPCHDSAKSGGSSDTSSA